MRNQSHAATLLVKRVLDKGVVVQIEPLVVAEHVDPDEGDHALEGDPVGGGHHREVDGGGGQHEAVPRLQRRPQLGATLRQHVLLTLHDGHGCGQDEVVGKAAHMCKRG